MSNMTEGLKQPDLLRPDCLAYTSPQTNAT